MKLISYLDDALQGIGALLTSTQFVDLTAAGFNLDMLTLIERFEELEPQLRALQSEARHRRTLATVKVQAPIPRPRRNIFCVGKNYRSHAMEFARSGFDASARGDDDIPEYPIIFSKPPSVVVASGDVIDAALDPHQSVDYEGELAVVIGRAGRPKDTEDALSYVFGYTVFNDVTSRALQKHHKQWLLGKGIDTFGPMGPAIVTRDELPSLENCRIRTWVNEELRQSAKIGDLIFGVPRLIAEIGRLIQLEPGDVIATGTPVGVGIGFNPPKFLRRGDRIRIEIDGVGTLENAVG